MHESNQNEDRKYGTFAPPPNKGSPNTFVPGESPPARNVPYNHFLKQWADVAGDRTFLTPEHPPHPGHSTRSTDVPRAVQERTPRRGSSVRMGRGANIGTPETGNM